MCQGFCHFFRFFVASFWNGQISHQQHKGFKGCCSSINGSTNWCPKIYLTSVICTYHTIENNFGMKHRLAKYSKESCIWSSDEQFSFKYLLDIAFVGRLCLLQAWMGWRVKKRADYMKRVDKKFLRALLHSFIQCIYFMIYFMVSNNPLVRIPLSVKLIINICELGK